MDKILIVEFEKCTGCRLCEMVCSVHHTDVNNPSRSRIHVVKWPRDGLSLPMMCQQCEEAPCMAVCPRYALRRDSEANRIVVDYDLCIGCKLCVAACPLGGMGIDTALRRVVKCDLCDGEPACVRFCDPGAVQFVPASSVNLRKKREACERLSLVLRKSAAVTR